MEKKNNNFHTEMSCYQFIYQYTYLLYVAFVFFDTSTDTHI